MDPYPLTPYFNPVAISFSISLHLTICLCKGIYLGVLVKELGWLGWSFLGCCQGNQITLPEIERLAYDGNLNRAIVEAPNIPLGKPYNTPLHNLLYNPVRLQLI